MYSATLHVGVVFSFFLLRISTVVTVLLNHFRKKPVDVYIFLYKEITFKMKKKCKDSIEKKHCYHQKDPVVLLFSK
jgi:hypothetical protein